MKNPMVNKPETDLNFKKFLVSEYLRHGSIDKVLKYHHFGLPISFASYHRTIKEFGIIKSAGPNSKLSESLYLLSLLANYKFPLEKIYRLYAPKRIQVSINTLHRIFHYTRLGLTRRQGTALIITTSKLNQILIGNDISLANQSLGQRGDYSLPMGHSKTGEDPKDSITRVLQQEVFSDLAANKNFPWSVVPKHPKPMMYINITDIRVAVYHLQIPDKYKFSSPKLTNLGFKKISDISSKELRPGVGDILLKYSELQKNPNLTVAKEFNSSLNTTLYAWCSKI
jgi:hypothetical protein